MASAYKPSFNLLEETHAAMVKAQSEMDSMRQNHSVRTGYWPSSASIERIENNHGRLESVVEGSCMRQSYYSMTGSHVTDPAGAQMQDIWDLGSAAEELYRERFQGLPNYTVLFPDVVGNKLRFQNPKTKVRGEADLILQHKETEIKLGIEMKSYYRAWGAMEIAGYNAAKKAYGSCCPYIRKDDAIRNKVPFPKIPNLLQTALYLEEFWNDGIELWKIIYVARDKGPYAEFDITLGDYKGKRCVIVDGVVIPWINLEAIHTRFKQLSEYIDANELPPRDFTPEYDDITVLDKVDKGELPKWVATKIKRGEAHRDWQCGCCNFLSKCLNDSKTPF